MLHDLLPDRHLHVSVCRTLPGHQEALGVLSVNAPCPRTGEFRPLLFVPMAWLVSVPLHHPQVREALLVQIGALVQAQARTA